MKTNCIILFLSILVFSCRENNNNPVKQKKQIIDSTKSKNNSWQNATREDIIDTIYSTENIVIFGDTTIDKTKIKWTSIKFEPYISFKDYKVTEIDYKSHAKINLSSNKEAKNYRTVLNKAYNCDTANFAGHYTFAFWGCGAPCQESMLIDRKTGKIYDAPFANKGYDFHLDSRMLIVNPPDSNDFYDDCSYCKPIIYIFDEENKTFIDIKKK